MTTPEFSRTVRVDSLGETPRRLSVAADEAERIALGRRFGLVAVDRLTAELTLRRNGNEVELDGIMSAEVTQACVATGEAVAAEIEAPFNLLFRPRQQQAAARDEEIELGEPEMDVVFYDAASIDIGEAVAETLFLNLDPYPRAPGAEQALRRAGVKSEEEAGPFAALAGLRDKLKP